MNTLHESTTPEAIADDQRDAVEAALLDNPNATPEEISETLCLHVWVTRRRLCEIRGTRYDKPRGGAKLNLLQPVYDWFKRNGPAIVSQAATSLGRSARDVSRIVSCTASGAAFTRAGTASVGRSGRTVIVWAARPGWEMRSAMPAPTGSGYTKAATRKPRKATEIVL